MTTAVLSTEISEVDSKIPDVNGLVKKTDHNKNYQILRKNTLKFLNILKLRLKYLMERYKNKNWSINLIFPIFLSIMI